MGGRVGLDATNDPLVTSFRTDAGRVASALLELAVAVHLRPLASGALAALVAARPNRISSSGRCRPDRFKLDQRSWPVLPGQDRTTVNFNLICNLELSAWESVQSGPSIWADLRNGLSVSDRESTRFTPVNGPLMARRPDHAGPPFRVIAARWRGWPRTLARLPAWPLTAGQSASGGSLSTVAAGHFRRKREAPL